MGAKLKAHVTLLDLQDGEVVLEVKGAEDVHSVPGVMHGATPWCKLPFIAEEELHRPGKVYTSGFITPVLILTLISVSTYPHKKERERRQIKRKKLYGYE